MIKVMFICHGNICRSPMAEFVMKEIIKNAGMESMFHIESSATSTEKIGNSVYPPVKRLLAEHGIGCNGKYARQITLHDYKNKANDLQFIFISKRLNRDCLSEVLFKRNS